MESCNDQYCNNRNDNVYIYANGSLCYGNDNGYCDHCTGDSNIYSDRTTVPEQCSTVTAFNITQWICRNMESCNDQYCNNRNDNVYIYANGSLCYGNDNGYCDHCTGDTNIHSDRTTVPEQCSTIIPSTSLMDLQEHGILQRSILQRPERQRIHLRQRIPVLR